MSTMTSEEIGATTPYLNISTFCILILNPNDLYILGRIGMILLLPLPQHHASKEEEGLFATQYVPQVLFPRFT